jgi:hypothetical protein
MTVHLPETTPSEQLLAVRIMLDVAHAACQRIATGAEEFADQQRSRATRCDELSERLRNLEVLP